MDSLLERNLLAAPLLTTGGPVDVYSGAARLAATVWASEVKGRDADRDTAIMFVHPTSNFLGHYMLMPLAERGYGAIGSTTRYLGADATVVTENCLLDMASMIGRLREIGYRKVVLVGNSGGAGIAPYYQAQAQNPTVTDPPGGGPDLTKYDLPPVDAIVMLNAHPGRATIICDLLDPAIIDERDPLRRSPDLDMFDPRNGPPYSDEFVEAYRAAQVARNRKISDWALHQLNERPDWPEGLADLPFVVYGTNADPRFLDGTLEPSEREIGVSLWGTPAEANYLPAGPGRFTTTRSWLNQWSLDHSNGNALRWMPELEVPLLVVYGSGDPICHPSHARQMHEASRGTDDDIVCIKGADHYFKGQPELLAEACDAIQRWLSKRL